MTQFNGFIDLNAQRLTRLERQHPNIKKRIYPRTEPDRQHVAPPSVLDDLLTEHRAESEPKPMPAKKKKRSPESIAKFKATLAAKKAAKFATADSGEKVEPVFDGLDLILDILDLCEKAKRGLTRSQRVRLKAALNERL